MIVFVVALTIAAAFAGVAMAALVLYTGRRDDEPPTPGWPDMTKRRP